MTINRDNIPQHVTTILEVLQKEGFAAYIVGGAVRDLVMGREPHDYDIATSATPQEVMGLFPKVVPTGIEYGTVTVMLDGVGYEVTTFRGDGQYGDGRRPDTVVFTKEIHRDLARRDFTMNAMAYDPLTNTMVDPFIGQVDTVRQHICTVGKPRDRFTEDGLRILRAIRFAAQLGFSIEGDTLEEIRRCRDMLRNVSVERIRDEFCKILNSKHPDVGLNLLHQAHVLPYVMPEASPMLHCGQNHYHDYDVWNHTVATVMAVSTKFPMVRLAAFFHDIGKPSVKLFDEKRNEHAFLKHDDAGAKITHDVMTRMKFSNDDRGHVVHLVENHMHGYSHRSTDAAVRRFIRRIGAENLDEFFALRFADLAATRANGIPEEDRLLTEEFQQRCQVQKDFTPKSSNALPVNGNDVQELRGIGPGREVGRILQALLEHVLDHPEDNDRDALLRLIPTI